MKVVWTTCIVLFLSSGCTDFPSGGITPDEQIYGLLGSIMVQVGPETFTASDCRGVREIPFQHGVIRTELHNQQEKAFIEIQYSIYPLNQTVGFSNLVLRIGSVDSLARFYTITASNSSFRLESKLEGNVVKALFGGWLDGTGSLAYGSRILVTRGTMHIMVE